MVFLEEVLFGFSLTVSRLVMSPLDTDSCSLSSLKFKLLSISATSSNITAANALLISEPKEAVVEICFFVFVPSFFRPAISIAAKTTNAAATAIEIIIHNLRRLAEGGNIVCFCDSSFIQ